MLDIFISILFFYNGDPENFIYLNFRKSRKCYIDINKPKIIDAATESRN